MSSAFYPLGMNSYNNRLPNGGYKTWKGTGVLSNPVGNTASNIRPLTNKDPGNIFPSKFGLPRPIKHFRKGRVITIPNIPEYVDSLPEKNKEISMINYNINRYVKSSTGASLGGGSGGMGLVSQIICNPGQSSFSQNNVDEISNTYKMDADCKSCRAISIVADYYPNNTYITENPNKTTTSKNFCCNEEKKARRRVLPASTILKKNYFTTLEQYRENRCKTYEQRAFNFQSYQDFEIDASKFNNPHITEAALKLAKPGGPLTTNSTYFANCQPNGEIYESLELNIILRFIQILKNNNLLTEDEITGINKIETIKELSVFVKNSISKDKSETVQNLFVDYITNPYIGVPLSGPSNPIGCKLVVYKPNNYQYAQQGAVSSSTKNLKLNVTTIETNLATFNNKTRGRKLGLTDEYVGTSRTIPFILKNKAPTCQPQVYLGQFQNPKTCFKGSNDQMIKNYNSSNFGPTPPTYFDAVYV